ncbi:hypothetical protein [Pseudomonas frederiksbergensis]|uniref:hypothetical protein n=1 Tax=Pseudomonas frederiksbergensis TaxID=104087 RepID=UPI003D1A9250
MSINRESFLEAKFGNNTEPMCRAVVVVRQLAPVTDHLLILIKLQAAFYVLCKDVNNGRKIAKVANDVMAQAGLIVSQSDFYHR